MPKIIPALPLNVLLYREALAKFKEGCTITNARLLVVRARNLPQGTSFTENEAATLILAGQLIGAAIHAKAA